MYTRHSPVLTCSCCGYRGAMKFLVNYCERDLETVKSPCGYLVHDILQPWGVAYELLQCPVRPALSKSNGMTPGAGGLYRDGFISNLTPEPPAENKSLR